MIKKTSQLLSYRRLFRGVILLYKHIGNIKELNSFQNQFLIADIGFFPFDKTYDYFVDQIFLRKVGLQKGDNVHTE